MATRVEAEDYLQSKNINKVLKYLTTELVIHRPDDPFKFLANLSTSISNQPSYAYSNTTADDLLMAAHTKTHKQIEHDHNSLKSPTPSEFQKQFNQLQHSIQRISAQLHSATVVDRIKKEVCQLLNCEGATLYSVDFEAQEMTPCSDNNDTEQLKIPTNKGICGVVAQTGKTEIVLNVSSNENYDTSVDGNGCKSEVRSMICAAIRAEDTQEIVAIIQAFNKGDNTVFNDQDVFSLELIGSLGFVALRNAMIFEIANSEQRRNAALIDLWSALKSDVPINSILFTITRRTLEIVEADRCTFYLVDKKQGKLWSIQGEINVAQTWDKGVVGWCARHGTNVNITDAYNDDRFDCAVDKKTGYVTKTILCVPMKSSDGEVIGVIQLINKAMDDIFTETDEHILELTLSAAAPVFKKTSHYLPSFAEAKNDSSDGKIFSPMGGGNIASTPRSEELPTLAETDEEGDEDSNESNHESEDKFDGILLNGIQESIAEETTDGSQNVDAKDDQSDMLIVD